MKTPSQSRASLFFFAGALLFLICLLLPAGLTGRSKAQQASDRREKPATPPASQQAETEKKIEVERDHPGEALQFRRLQLQDKNGYIPPDGNEKARQHVRRMKQFQEERLKAQVRSGKNSTSGVQEAGFEYDSWEWLGPGNIGGRIRSIVIHPTQPANMWAGSVSGGIWRTTDGGTSWAPVNDFMANLAVSTMIIDPANPNILYAGTGEIGFRNIDAVRGAGVFKSTDGGTTWNQLSSTDNANWHQVNRLAISPNGSRLLATTGGSIEWSTNGGNTWTQAISATPSAFFSRVRDLDFHPTSNNEAIAGAEGVAWYSTNGGQTWTVAQFTPAVSGRIELAYAPSNPMIVYASVNQNNGEIYRSADGGQNYTRVNTGSNYFFSSPPGCPAPTENIGWYANTIWVNPQDPNFIVVGSVDLWRSSDGGQTLFRFSSWCQYNNQNQPTSIHADHHVIVAHPNFNIPNNGTVFFGNDGGIYRSNTVTVATPAWTALNNNLGITQFYGGAGNANAIIGGAQDNGILRYTPTTGWTISVTGDGGFCAADPNDPNILYSETQYLNFGRSTDAGVTFNTITGGLTEANNSTTANFIAPFILDPNTPNTILAGGLSLWRSTNANSVNPAPTWTAIKAPIGTAVNTDAISAIAVFPSIPPGTNPGIIVVGYNNGQVWLTNNGNNAVPTWTRIDSDAPALPATGMITSITISYAGKIYVTKGGYNANNVWVRSTTDILPSPGWQDISGNGFTGLPDVPVYTLTLHPRRDSFGFGDSLSEYLYVGTEAGFFSSSDGGANWSPSTAGPANVPVNQLFWLGNDLIAVTHGRGMYRASGGIYVDKFYVGPEDGTFNQPFSTILGGINAVTRYQTVWLNRLGPIFYFEPIIINPNKRLELRALKGFVHLGPAVP